MGDTRKLGQILLDMVGFDEEKIEEALEIQKERGGRIGEILVSSKVVSPEDVTHALSAQLDIPVMGEIDVNNVDAELVKRVPINFAKQQQVLPLSETEDEVVVAVADPLNTFVLDDGRGLLGRTIRPVLAEGQIILDGINRLYDRASGEAEALVDDLEETDLDSLAQERSQDVGKSQINLFVDVNLSDAGQLVLDRVLDGQDVDLGRIDFGQGRIQGRGFTATGRAGNQHDTVAHMNQLIHRA